MKKVKKINKRLFILMSLPILVFLQYFLFKFGVLSPMVKGVEIKVVNGDYVTDIDEYTIRLNETVKLSSGQYICIPSYAKKPNIWFNVLDNKNILKIDGDNLTALEEGISTIAVMKNKRVLRKVNIRVIEPKVEDIIYNIDKKLQYVGDSAKITSEVKVDYDKFKEKEKAVYESSNEEVIKIKDGNIEAVGVGKAQLYIKSKDKVEKVDYNIKAKIANISIGNKIEVEIGKTKKLSPNIITSPVGLVHPKVKYELIENRLPIQRNISINKDGVVEGLREGEEKIKITCGDKSKIITIKVTKESLTNNKIKNIEMSYEVVDGKLLINLAWDYIESIDEYYIYLKNESLGEKEFSLYEFVNANKGDKESKRVKATIKVDLAKGKIPNISIYVAGKTKYGTTNPSETVSIKAQVEEKEDITDLQVENLVSEINSENNKVKLTWDKLDISGVKYSMYVKNNLLGQEGFVLLDGDIQSNEYLIDISPDNTDIEVYIKGSKDDKYSKHSNIVHIKKEITNEDSDLENEPEESI